MGAASGTYNSDGFLVNAAFERGPASPFTSRSNPVVSNCNVTTRTATAV